MSSNVGSAAVYEAGDQRNPAESEKEKPTPYEEGKENSHKDNDASKLPSREMAFEHHKQSWHQFQRMNVPSPTV